VREADRLFAAGQWKEALEWYGKASEFRPDDRHVRDRIVASKSRIDEARVRIEREAAEARTSEERERLRREEAERAGRERERRCAEAKPHLDRGRQLVENARMDLYKPTARLAQARAQMDDAVRALDEAVRLFPDDGEAYFWRARAKGTRLDPEGALADYGEALRLQLGVPSYHLERGRLLLERHIEEMLHLGWILGPAEQARVKPWRDRAEADFRKALEGGAAEDRSYLSALLAFCESRIADCVSACDQMLQKERSREELWKLRADALHFALGDFDRAGLDARQREKVAAVIRSYSEALRCRANYYEALIMRGYEYESLGDFDRARSDFERAMEMRPDDPLGLWFVAGWHLRQGEATARGQSEPDAAARRHYELALEVLDRGLLRRRDSYVLRMNRAVCLGNLKRYDEAIEDVKRAIELNGSHYFAWYLKGAVLSRQGDAAEAARAMEASLRLNPNFASTWFNAGALYQKLNRRADARRCFEKALELGHPAERQIREALRDLTGK
jgi:tetratricopeptide (TPR) repeat protein